MRRSRCPARLSRDDGEVLRGPVQIERLARQTPSEGETRADYTLRLRQQHSLPVLAAFKTWLDNLAPKVLPESYTGKAISYTQNQWDYLTQYTCNGLAPIDNNILERDIRPFVTGRKSWLFSDTVAGAKASAVIYSLVLTCRACGVEPYAWLRHVLTELPRRQTDDDIEDLMPFNFAERAPHQNTCKARYVGLVHGYDCKPKRRLFDVLKSQGLQPNQDVTFLADGGEEIRALTELVTPKFEHVLDWFHITMRVTVLEQYARGVAHHDAAAGQRLLDSLESIKWLLWHGNQHRSRQEIEFFEDDVAGLVLHYPHLGKFARAAHEFAVYITSNTDSPIK